MPLLLHSRTYIFPKIKLELTSSKNTNFSHNARAVRQCSSTYIHVNWTCLQYVYILPAEELQIDVSWWTQPKSIQSLSNRTRISLNLSKHAPFYNRAVVNHCQSWWQSSSGTGLQPASSVWMLQAPASVSILQYTCSTSVSPFTSICLTAFMV